MTERPDQRRTLLIVDDDALFRMRLVRAFEERGYEVWNAAEIPAALELARAESPEFAIVDLRLEEASGLELIRGLLALDPTTRIVILTGYGSIATALAAVRAGAVHYLTKPALIEEMITALEGRAVSESLPAAAEVPSLERVEWEHIHRVLHDCGGNITRAAQMLGLHRRSLQRKLGKYAPD